jgi:2-phospho-L-lactate guanylyltransferase
LPNHSISPDKANNLEKNGKTWALVPVKAFDNAKTRLRPVLAPGQCAELARHMAQDVIEALRNARFLDGVSLLGHESEIAAFADDSNCDFIAEDPASDLSAKLDFAARKLRNEGVDILLVVPGDLPMLRPVNVDRLLDAHTRGLSICPASRDHGTNALVISPPGAIEFRFGHLSARRHLQAARAVRLPCQELSSIAFSRDIDTPDDLAWFCRHPTPGRTAAYLQESGICENLLGSDRTAIA